MNELSERTIGEWLQWCAEHDPEKEYIVFSDRNLRWSYRYFNQRVDELAKGLMAIGVERGAHVGIWASNIPDWATMFFACARIGAVSVLVNTNFKRVEAEELMRRSDMDVLCIGDHAKGNDLVGITYDILPELCETDSPECLRSARLPRLRRVVYFGTEAHKGMYSLNDVMMRALMTTDEDYAARRAQVKCRDLVNIQYTSGTTGFPKGAMLSHYGVCNNAMETGRNLCFSPLTRLCLCVPFFHCFGLVLGMLNCLVHHCTMVVTEVYDPLLVLASIHKERCTHIFGVPTMYLGILNHPMFSLFDMRSLQGGIMAGSIVPVELARRVEREMHLTLCTEYGFTEASPGMTGTRLDEPFDVRVGTVGRPFAHVEVGVLDAQGRPCPRGVEGELCNRGYNSMLGYYRDAEGTAAAFDAEGWLHTGDLGYEDGRGYFHVTGRKTEMIIRGGENIYPYEVESFLYRLPQIKLVQVVGVPSEKYGESVGAFIELKEGARLEATDVRSFCRNQIAHYKIPKYIFFVHEWPLTGSGKVQRRKLKEMSLALCREMGIEVI